jgi:hypothetical protein
VRIFVAAIVVLTAAGCSSGGSRSAPTAATVMAPATSTTARRSSSTAPATTTTTAAARRRAPLALVVEENHSYDQIIGSARAPRINGLATTGVLFTDYYAITHPSLPNYLALLSGDTLGITSDCTTCSVDAPNLATQMQSAGVSWRAYMQGLPSPCSNASFAGAYAKKHDPFMYFASVRDDPAACQSVVPLDQFWADAAAGRLPDFAFLVPDLDSDMHGTPSDDNDSTLVPAADAVVGRIADALSASPSWTSGSRLVVTWDEGDNASCCGGLARGGRVPTVAWGPGLAPGRDNGTATHYDLLGAIERRVGLPFLGHATMSRDLPAVSSA